MSASAPDISRAVRLHRRRIYILPTRQGWAFAGALLVMLIGSVNYDNGLGYALTFLLASLALVSTLHTHRNLAGLGVEAVGVSPAFAGGDGGLHLRLDNRGFDPRPALAVRYATGPGGAQTDRVRMLRLEADTLAAVTVAVPAPRRGRMRMPRLTLTTRYPLGLFRAWSTYRPGLACLVYPRPEGSRALPGAHPDDRADGRTGGSGPEDFAGMREYRPGDSPRHIHWRAAARGHGLPVKLFSGAASAELMLRWADTAGADEARLCQLTRWALDAQTQGLRFGLDLPGVHFDADSGEAHLHRCLEALAVHGLGAVAPYDPASGP